MSVGEAEGLRNGRGMQAAVAHMAGTGTRNPGGVRVAHTAFEQGSGRIHFMALGVETWD